MKEHWVKKLLALLIMVALLATSVVGLAERLEVDGIDLTDIEVLDGSELNLEEGSAELDIANVPFLQSDEAEVSSKDAEGTANSEETDAVVNASVPENVKLGTGDKYTLKTGYKNKKTIYSSSNKRVATVNSNGLITAKTAGNTTITVKVKLISGFKTFKCKVKVVNGPKTVKMNEKRVSLIKGGTFQLKPKLTPEKTYTYKYTWKSSNRSVAKVSDNGLVTAVKVGKAVITLEIGSGKKAECEVTVNPPTKFSVNHGSDEILSRSDTNGTATMDSRAGNGDLYTLTVTSNYSWTVSASNNGWFSMSTTSGSEGTTDVVLTLMDTKPGTKYSSTLTFDVNGEERYVKVKYNPLVIKPDGISLNMTEKQVVFGIDSLTYTLVATVSPSDATDKRVVWSSSNTSLATVDDNGNVTIVGAEDGAKVTITAKTVQGGYKAKCVFTLIDPRQISVSHQDLGDIIKDGTVMISTINVFNGKGHMNWTVSGRTDWTVSTTSSWFTVSKTSDTNLYIDIPEGISKGSRSGKVTIKVGTKSFTITLRQVTPNGISLNMTEKQVVVGIDPLTYTLVATVSPSDATDKRVTWSSSNTSLVTVDDNGNVTIVGVEDRAKVTITAETVNGYKAKCVFTLIDPRKISVSHPDVGDIIKDGSIKVDTVNVFNGKGYMNWTVSGRTDWTVSTTSNWFTVSKTSDTNLYIDIPEGISKGSRTGKVAITVGTESYKITLKQVAPLSFTVMHVSDTILSESSTSGTTDMSPYACSKDVYTLTITSNYSWTVSASNKDWFTMSRSSGGSGTVDLVLTLKNIHDGQNYTSTLTFTVNGVNRTVTVNLYKPVIEPTSVSLDMSNKYVRLGYDSLTYTLTATVSPSNATDKSVTWSSSDEGMATVSSSGKVTIKDAGAGDSTVTITASTKNGKKATCTFKIDETRKPEYVAINSCDFVASQIKSTVQDGTEYDRTNYPLNKGTTLYIPFSTGKFVHRVTYTLVSYGDWKSYGIRETKAYSRGTTGHTDTFTMRLPSDLPTGYYLLRVFAKNKDSDSEGDYITLKVKLYIQ